MRVATKAILICLFAGGLQAKFTVPTITEIWVNNDGDESSDTWTDPTNWKDGSVPLSDGTAGISFPGETGFDFDFDEDSIPVHLNVDFNLSALFFDQQAIYSFYSSGVFRELTIQDFIQTDSGELESYIFFGDNLNLKFGDGLKLDLGYGTEVEIGGQLSNVTPGGSFFLEGGGTLLLSYDNSSTVSGDIFVREGFLGLADDEAAGTADIELGDASSPGSNFTGLIAVDGDRSLANDITVNGRLETLEDEGERNELNLLGLATFTSDTQINNYGGLLNFIGGTAESTPGVKLTVVADEPIIFSGPSGFTGGLHVNEGVAIFADLSALPSGPAGTAFSSDTGETYIGLMVDSATDRLAATAAFLALFDPTNFKGTIGFDTDPGLAGPPNVYSGNIDLSSMTVGKIGSVTTAELTGTITPSGTDYEFGGGAGTLIVSSLLEDPPISAPLTSDNPMVIVAGISTPATRGITVESENDDPLTVFINNGSNSFSGTVSSTHSAVVFGSAPGALPTGALLQPGDGGYIGLQDSTRSISSYLGQFDSGLDRGIIGFDSPDSSTNRTISDAIDLSGFTATNPDFYLGTSTWVNLSGAITLPGGADYYRFAGFKGGFLDVSTVLTDGSAPRGVIIGDKNSTATQGHTPAASDMFDTSGVSLVGINTYSGGTMLEAGLLGVSNNSSLGTGTLSVVADNGSGGFTSLIMYGEDDSDFTGPILFPNTDNLDLGNPVEVDSFFEVKVEKDSTDRNLTLSGDISGSGGINKSGGGTLNLSGENSGFTGGIYISEGTVNVNGDTSAGTGPVAFGGGLIQELVFNTANPSIGGLHEIGYDEYSSSYATVQLGTGTTLTLDLGGLDVEFGGSIMGDGTLRLSGSGTQALTGFNSFTGGLEVVNGANLEVDSSGALGASYPTDPAVLLDGGFLTLDGDPSDSYSSIPIDLSFGSSGAEIRGEGRLSFSEDLTIGSGVSISPGHSIGEIHFDGPLVLGELGSLNVEIGDGDDLDEIVADFMFANAIEITASSSNPFSINLLGEDGDVPLNFDPLQAYSWSVALAADPITDFDANHFQLNIASNLASITTDGIWDLSLASSGSSFGEIFLTNNVLQVSFTPVPEPATFTLLALGLGLVGFRRPRRNA